MAQRISVVVPIHDMPNGAFFLWRCVNSIVTQSFQDYELIITKHGKMAENTNAGIGKATGDIIKILFMDDYFAYPHALQEIADTFKGGWLVSGCEHDNGQEIGNYHTPSYHGIPNLQNTIGSPSVLAFERESPFLFDVDMSWLLDVDLYRKLYERYGEPTILDFPNVIIGLHQGQTTHTMSDEDKQKELDYLRSK